MLARQFLVPEVLQQKPAEAYVKAPREGKGFPAMARAWQVAAPPPSKRARADGVMEGPSSRWQGESLLPFIFSLSGFPWGGGGGFPFETAN